MNKHCTHLDSIARVVNWPPENGHHKVCYF
jgi:hypothetical protein